MTEGYSNPPTVTGRFVAANPQPASSWVRRRGNIDMQPWVPWEGHPYQKPMHDLIFSMNFAAAEMRALSALFADPRKIPAWLDKRRTRRLLRAAAKQATTHKERHALNHAARYHAR